jgi:hypothetical protein
MLRPGYALRPMLRGGMRAAFATGPGYEPQPLGSHARFDGDAVGGYFVDLRPKTLRELTPFVTGRGIHYGITPTMRAQQALGWWERHLDGDEIACPRFLALADELIATADVVGDSLLWRYDMDVPKYGRRAPWFSSMAQGQAASVLVRAYIAVQDERYAEAAAAAVRPITSGRDTKGLVTQTADGPILEECPSEPRSHILNGWIYALWGLWDVAGLGVADALAAFELSTRTLRARLGDYDLGWWSLYSLYPGHTDVATPFYHRIHATQIDVMHRLTGWREFDQLHERWKHADRLPNSARAIVTKSALAVRDISGALLPR